MVLIFLCFALLFPTEPANANVQNTQKKTIMVFAPHQDDEANMANAIMWSHAKRGDNVYVVMGFGSDHGGSDVSYGLHRLKESRTNMETLDIPGENLIYLGYQKIDYAAKLHTDNTLPLGTDGAMLRTDGTPYYTFSHKDDGFPSYHFTKYGVECEASEANLVSDIIDVITQYMPDELYVINFDKHIEHQYMGSMVDKAFGILKQKAEFKDYCPRYYQSMSYQSAWNAKRDFTSVLSPNDSGNIFLESTLVFDPNNPTFDWNDRVRFPVEDEMSMPSDENLSIKAYRQGFKSYVRDFQREACVNGDQVFWERDTRNLAFQARVEVSSCNADRDKINDFSTMRTPLTSFITNCNHHEKDIDCSEYKWSPAKDDTSKTVTLNFDMPRTIGTIKLYDDYRTENQIKAGILTFSDGSTIEVNSLNNDGGANTISFAPKEKITSVSFQITDYTGTPGLTEFEVYAPTEPRETDFIQIYLDGANGTDWENKSFLYDYPVNITFQDQTMQLGVYCYPDEETLNYNWELVGDPQGLTLTQNGLLTVTADAVSGTYQIKVTANNNENLTDVMNIQVRGKRVGPWDINMDGICDYRDLACVLMGLDGFYQDCADVNVDGKIDTADVSLVWKHIKLGN